jgi:LuxR family maltose regulon positive regulatory protein
VPLTTDSLVSTKLRPSQARPASVARPRLTARLEREAGRKLTLISAPAGFGKTTLLVEWLKGREIGDQCVAWVSLDEGDNDPVRFLSYLVGALRRSVGEGFGEGVLAALRSPGPPRMEAVVGAFVNELVDLPGKVAVVLDDYHVIDSESVHRIVTFLLERLPENVHLVISGRLEREQPERLAPLHLRDSEWYEENASVAEAVRQARGSRMIRTSAGRPDDRYGTCQLLTLDCYWHYSRAREG